MVRFELTKPVSLSDLKSDAINHSATLPVAPPKERYVLFLASLLIHPFLSRSAETLLSLLVVFDVASERFQPFRGRYLYYKYTALGRLRQVNI